MAGPLLPEAVAEILKLKEAGYSNAEIARRTGHSRSTVVRYVKERRQANIDAAVAAAPAAALTEEHIKTLIELAEHARRRKCPKCSLMFPRLASMARGICPRCGAQWWAPPPKKPNR